MIWHFCFHLFYYHHHIHYYYKFIWFNMSVLTTLTKKLEDYTELNGSSSETSTKTKTNDTLTENAYGLLDLFIYYMMNIVLFMILFIDLIVEFVNNCIHKYNIVSCSFRHKLYNNINWFVISLRTHTGIKK